MVQVLPRWAWNRILERAQVLNLRRKVLYNAPTLSIPIHRTMLYDDVTAAEQLMQGEVEKEQLRYIVNTLAQQTMRGSPPAYQVAPSHNKIHQKSLLRTHPNRPV